MARPKKNGNDLTATNLLHSLRCRGGSAPLHTIYFSNVAIQSLLEQNLVKVKNTGCGFVLELIEQT
ncbi:hypothetical protein [Nostoc parmelioides]|uniref:Uncharacterized protein n=1 Tax=Nostoc parmelioides FACHB-3921 TaxID=2692909 RepID=A0ABR8BI31_9NOSO|nr:hypothetical protein [Nostoc parmelioides]MBD2253354.1 hypothetical protein [Nostoc parmelioides FACHB-3921]